jgi:hypothetical protein
MSTTPAKPDAYSWPDHAIFVAQDLELRIDDAITSARDLATISRGHYASAAAASFSDAIHDLRHAVDHVTSARRALQRVHERAEQVKEGE